MLVLAADGSALVAQQGAAASGAAAAPVLPAASGSAACSLSGQAIMASQRATKSGVHQDCKRDGKQRMIIGPLGGWLTNGGTEVWAPDRQGGASVLALVKQYTCQVRQTVAFPQKRKEKSGWAEVAHDHGTAGSTELSNPVSAASKDWRFAQVSLEKPWHLPYNQGDFTRGPGHIGHSVGS